MEINSKIITIIVDDEPRARRLLRTMIAENCPNLFVVDVAANVDDAELIIKKHNPQLVFLDIEMPNKSGFELLEIFGSDKFNLIFTTAYSDYAIKAFEVSAIDYLLKPIQTDQLVKAVAKVKKAINEDDLKQKIEALQNNLDIANVKRIGLPSQHGLKFVMSNEIIYFKAEGSYSKIILTDDKRVMVSKKLGDMENLVKGIDNFTRIHRSYIVNTDHITEFMKTDGGTVKLSNGDIVSISRDRKDEVQRKIKSL
ncbi:MAG: LytTR family DNA-binding domain-containing protein [Bacteroidota bacterium]|nr:LytTR family DNA-binding domain-containing protein [Bacteroidota bacterium]